MRAKLRQLALNIALVAGSVLVCLLLPRIRGVRNDPEARRRAAQRLDQRRRALSCPTRAPPSAIPTARSSLVTINATGLELDQALLQRAKTPGVLRVAVIGDSYVHGSFVDSTEGFPEVIERQLNAAGVRAEVLRFGMDGAPLSQYLHMLRREVRGLQAGPRRRAADPQRLRRELPLHENALCLELPQDRRRRGRPAEGDRARRIHARRADVLRKLQHVPLPLLQDRRLPACSRGW